MKNLRTNRLAISVLFISMIVQFFWRGIYFPWGNFAIGNYDVTKTEACRLVNRIAGGECWKYLPSKDMSNIDGFTLVNDLRPIMYGIVVTLFVWLFPLSVRLIRGWLKWLFGEKNAN